MAAPQHVLVAYESRNGGTSEIAEWIGTALREEGLPATVLPASTIGTLHPFTAVVLGSGVYEGRWLRGAVRFAHRNRRDLLERPVWLFSSGPLDPTVDERDVPPVPSALGVADAVDAREHMTFGGRLVSGARGLLARLILRRGGGGDFRDPDSVREWAHAISRELMAEPTPR
ncbi:flavodoxin domain-containing protein [Actinacidiphila acididurans]|uniref:Flavodoxin n=1 Tax=Actinacidiphila acididurans TaxID=2784346 RepID=A0ABS2TM68_9ACTN|nr:flavodoxin domain-containing protein [Actinacidiphila acididurans]MBM9504438.1 flavodoxin [Actinacidiphila acididurans]